MTWRAWLIRVLYFLGYLATLGGLFIAIWTLSSLGFQIACTGLILLVVTFILEEALL